MELAFKPHSFLDEYLSLGQPSQEQRFRFQRELFLNAIHNQQSISSYGMELDGKPIHFSDWKSKAEFHLDDYAKSRTGSNVLFRGVEFQSGDILLCNRSRGSDGMFTTLIDGLQNFAHVAIYALLESEGEHYPAVVEIHYQGIRAVPLKVFLDENFSTYVEIYRSREIKATDLPKISAVCAEMMAEPHGFDVDMDESQDKYVSCALTAAQLYRRAGLKAPASRSRYHAGTQANLEFLGNSSSGNRDLLMPDNFSNDPGFFLVGVVDHGKFLTLLGRALVRERMQEIWQTKTMKRKKLPIWLPIGKLAVRAVQKRIWPLDRMVARGFGFPPESFPSGPATFIALVPVVEEKIEAAADQVVAGLVARKEEVLQHSRWQELRNSPPVRELVVSAMREFESLFVARD